MSINLTVLVVAGPDSGRHCRRVFARLGRRHWFLPDRPKWRRFIPALTLDEAALELHEGSRREYLRSAGMQAILKAILVI